eukprot:COSAG02_NODE_842_length_16609_cov_117.586675_16_plen_80_part_00
MRPTANVDGSGSKGRRSTAQRRAPQDNGGAADGTQGSGGPRPRECIVDARHMEASMKSRAKERGRGRGAARTPENRLGA